MIVLVTGVAGFIGMHTAQRLLDIQGGRVACPQRRWGCGTR